MQNENIYYFMDKYYDFKEDEEEIQAQLEAAESKSQLLQRQLTDMRKMGDKMVNFNIEDYTIPRLMMRLKKSVYPSLLNVYDDLIKKGEVYKNKLECDTDEKYIETYIAYVTFRLQKQIIDKVSNKKQPGN
jgi:hypothetical protein